MRKTKTNNYPKEQQEQSVTRSQPDDLHQMRTGCQQQHDKTDLTRLEDYRMYYLGALLATRKVLEMVLSSDWKTNEKPYREATLRLITHDKRSMQLFMDGCYDICFRNHKRDRKGKVIWAEAYFAERRTRYEEVR